MKVIMLYHCGWSVPYLIIRCDKFTHVDNKFEVEIEGKTETIISDFDYMTVDDGDDKYDKKVTKLFKQLMKVVG